MIITTVDMGLNSVIAQLPFLAYQCDACWGMVARLGLEGVTAKLGYLFIHQLAPGLQ